MRKFWLITLGIVFALLAAEICLQIGAWVLWRGRSLPEASGTATGGILCVGDSFTYGLGALDRERNAYPHALEQMLDAPGAPPVINAGWPGQDSRAVLAQLEGQLAAYRPRLVYALVGYNDFWKSTPDDAAADDGFPIRFRLGAFASLVYHAISGTVDEGADQDPARDAKAPGAAPFLGAWHVGPAWFEFRADGTIDSSGGALPFLWSWDATTIQLRDRATGGTESSMVFSLADDVLTLEGGPFPAAIPLARGLPNGDAFERGFRALRAGNHADAERELSAALGTARDAEARATLIGWLAREGNDDAARQLLDPWTRAWSENRDPDSGRALVTAHLELDDVAAAMRIAGALLATRPVDDELATVVVHAAGRLDDPSARAELIAAVRAGAQRDGQTDAGRLSLYGLVHALAPDDPNALADAFTAVLLAAPDNPVVERILVWDREDYPRDAIQASLNRLDPSGTRHAASLARYDDVVGSTRDHTDAGLTAGLYAIANTCRTAGVEIVLLTYPTDRPRIRQATLAFAKETGVPVVDVFETFRTRVPDPTEHAKLFVLDGHCNDEGYRLMAEILAADARTRLGG